MCAKIAKKDWMGKPLQVVFDGCAFGVCRAFGLEEVGFYHVGVGVLRNPAHVFGLFDVVFKQIAETQTAPAHVAKVANVVVYPSVR